MRQMFVNKVKETEAELKEKEREVSSASRCRALYFDRDAHRLLALVTLSKIFTFVTHTCCTSPYVTQTCTV